MFQMRVDVKNMFTNEVVRNEYIPMYSLFSSTAYADKVRMCADVARVLIMDSTTGEIVYDSES